MVMVFIENATMSAYFMHYAQFNISSYAPSSERNRRDLNISNFEGVSIYVDFSINFDPIDGTCIPIMFH